MWRHPSARSRSPLPRQAAHHLKQWSSASPRHGNVFFAHGSSMKVGEISPRLADASNVEPRRILEFCAGHRNPFRHGTASMNPNCAPKTRHSKIVAALTDQGLGFGGRPIAIYYERAISCCLKSHIRERRDFRRGLERPLMNAACQCSRKRPCSHIREHDFFDFRRRNLPRNWQAWMWFFVPWVHRGRDASARRPMQRPFNRPYLAQKRDFPFLDTGQDTGHISGH